MITLGKLLLTLCSRDTSNGSHQTGWETEDTHWSLICPLQSRDTIRDGHRRGQGYPWLSCCCCLFSGVCLKTEYWRCVSGVSMSHYSRSRTGAQEGRDHGWPYIRCAGDHKVPGLLSLRGNCPPPPHDTGDLFLKVTCHVVIHKLACGNLVDDGVRSVLCVMCIIVVVFGPVFDKEI